ncbi:MAG: LuxR C-terminal-related transcriptional regulator [Bacillota bacterium]|nr:LuxR C-terminal-related transcriptional regulator [Bacillota bacterium]
MVKENFCKFHLLKAKYSIPRVSKQLLPRMSINCRLEDSLRHKLTIITAPAGYGKTAAVLKWLEDKSILLPYSWFSIDANDNDSFVFWRYFCAALNSISKEVSKIAEYIFSPQGNFDYNTHLSIIINTLSTIQSDFLLILDDFYFIENPIIFDNLSSFITYMPSNMHIIIISRRGIPLKLSKLSLNEELVVIGTKELQFDTKEINEYYKLKEYFFQEKDIHKIENYTEGWAAALAALDMSYKNEKNRHSIVSSFVSSDLYLENYFDEDVYNTWTSEQQDFMEKISISDRLCDSLCKKITGYDGDKLLNELYDQNCFLESSDYEGKWFRYHPLFLSFLRKKLLKINAASVQTLHYKAGEWFKVQGFFDEAVNHFLKGFCYEDALSLIEKCGESLIRKGEYSIVISWIERLPQKYVENSMMIKIIKAAYFITIYDFNNAWNYIEQLQFCLNGKNNYFKSIYTTYLLIKADFFIRQGDIKNTLQSVKEAAVGGQTDIIMNTEYIDFNLFDSSIFRCPYHSLIKILKVNFNEYKSLVINYRSVINTKVGYESLVKGELYYEIGKVNEAIPELLTSIDQAVISSCAGSLVPAMVTIAKIKRIQGNIQSAIGVIEEYENKVADLCKSHWIHMLNAFKVKLYIDLNNTELIDKWINENRLNIYQNIISANEYELIVMSRVLIYKQYYNDANILLNRLLNFAAAQKKNHSIVEIRNLLAITAMKEMNEELAEKHLESALSIGIKEGYMRSFVDEFAPMISLLEMYINKNKKNGKIVVYAKELLTQTKEAIKNFIVPASSHITENILTSMEKKVLHLITNAYTNKEIAEKLGITVRTVKAHTTNIYTKLDVKNRMQCIKILYKSY